MPQRKAIRGFSGHRPIEVNAIAFANAPKIANRLGKPQRRSLRNTRNPATQEGGSATHN